MWRPIECRAGAPPSNLPPSRGRCRRSRQRGVFGGGGGMRAARILHRRRSPAGRYEQNASGIPQPSRRAPPSVLPDISPSRGEIELGRAPCDAAGAEACGDRSSAVPALHPPISPLEGEMSARPTEGGLRWWRQGMAARIFLGDEAPRAASRKRQRHSQPSRRAPPSVLPDISPSRGEIELGRAPCDAAGAEACGDRSSAVPAPHPPISPLEGEMSAWPTEGGLRWWRRGAGSANFPRRRSPAGRLRANASGIPSRAAAHPPCMFLPDISPSRGEIELGRASRDAAGAEACGDRSSAVPAPHPPISPLPGGDVGAADRGGSSVVAARDGSANFPRRRSPAGRFAQTPAAFPAEPPCTPLCPAGHLPLKGGDRTGAGALRCGGC